VVKDKTHHQNSIKFVIFVIQQNLKGQKRPLLFALHCQMSNVEVED
jgi:hypothetical protein